MRDDNVQIVTGWHPKGWHEYAFRFPQSFKAFWRGSLPTAYVECFQPCTGVIQRNVMECYGLADFLKRHSDDPSANGREVLDSWKPKDRALGYNWRFDAVKFCKQLFIPHAEACIMNDGEILAWFDADVVATAPFGPADLAKLLETADLAYLGRDGKHSEIGFWIVRLNRRSRAFLYDLGRMYASDDVFGLPEWHSAYVFDFVRKVHQQDGLDTHNLTPGGRGHVWFQSRLGSFSDHCKGDRKKLGKSPERPAA